MKISLFLSLLFLSSYSFASMDLYSFVGIWRPSNCQLDIGKVPEQYRKAVTDYAHSEIEISRRPTYPDYPESADAYPAGLFIEGVPVEKVQIGVREDKVNKGAQKLSGSFCNLGGCNDGKYKYEWNTKLISNTLYLDQKSCRTAGCKTTFDYWAQLQMISSDTLIVKGQSFDKIGYVPYTMNCQYTREK